MVSREGGLTSKIGSEPFLACIGNGQVERQIQGTTDWGRKSYLYKHILTTRQKHVLYIKH